METFIVSNWELPQFQKLSQTQPDLAARALRRLLVDDEELRWAMVVSAYRDGVINLGKAAELLGKHALTLRQEFIGLGIPVRIGPETVAEARAEVEALRSWRNSQV